MYITVLFIVKTMVLKCYLTNSIFIILTIDDADDDDTREYIYIEYTLYSTSIRFKYLQSSYIHW